MDIKMLKKNKVSARYKKDIMWAYIFIAPMSIGLLLFLAYPLLSSIYISLSEYNLFSSPEFVGLSQFAKVFSDETFLNSFKNVLYSALGVPLGIILALVICAFLVRIERGALAYRIIFFIPTICGAVAVTFIWSWMYAPIYGILDNLCYVLNINTVDWLSSSMFMPSMIIMGLWGGVGVSILLVYSAMRNVPRVYYEAAQIDGANAIRQFFAITLSAISPIVFYILITGLIGAFQDFTRFQVISGGSYGSYNMMPVWWIYLHTGSFGYQYGYASALGLVLGLFIMIISAINFFVSKYWVNYD